MSNQLLNKPYMKRRVYTNMADVPLNKTQEYGYFLKLCSEVPEWYDWYYENLKTGIHDAQVLKRNNLYLTQLEFIKNGVDKDNFFRVVFNYFPIMFAWSGSLARYVIGSGSYNLYRSDPINYSWVVAYSLNCNTISAYRTGSSAKEMQEVMDLQRDFKLKSMMYVPAEGGKWMTNAYFSTNHFQCTSTDKNVRLRKLDSKNFLDLIKKFMMLCLWSDWNGNDWKEERFTFVNDKKYWDNSLKSLGSEDSFDVRHREFIPGREQPKSRTSGQITGKYIFSKDLYICESKPKLENHLYEKYLGDKRNKMYSVMLSDLVHRNRIKVLLYKDDVDGFSEIFRKGKIINAVVVTTDYLGGQLSQKYNFLSSISEVFDMSETNEIVSRMMLRDVVNDKYPQATDPFGPISSEEELKVDFEQCKDKLKGFPKSKLPKTSSEDFSNVLSELLPVLLKDKSNKVYFMHPVFVCFIHCLIKRGPVSDQDIFVKDVEKKNKVFIDMIKIVATILHNSQMPPLSLTQKLNEDFPGSVLNKMFDKDLYWVQKAIKELYASICISNYHRTLT